MLRTISATRYVTPLREGGSLPAIVEADDLGLYVLKFRGAGQGPLALVSELIAGEIGRVLGLNVPELVIAEVDGALARNEGDPEIRDLLNASIGLNVALDYLPGSVMFDPAAGDTADEELASRAVWFDSFVTNVDRTAYNPNLLCWHKSLYFIDHGASLYFHHNWDSYQTAAMTRFEPIRKHVLLKWANKIEDVDAVMRPTLTEAVFTTIVRNIPDTWLESVLADKTPEEKRAAYVAYLMRRLNAAPGFVEEATRARAELI